MDTLWHSLPLLVACFTFGGLAEHYRRHRDRRSVATMLAAEVRWMLETGATGEQSMVDMTANLPRIAQFDFSEMYTFDPTYAPVYEKSIDRIGLLPAEIAADIVSFFGLMTAVRIQVRNFISITPGMYPNVTAARQFHIDLGMRHWAQARDLAPQILTRLDKEARRAWVDSWG